MFSPIRSSSIQPSSSECPSLSSSPSSLSDVSIEFNDKTLNINNLQKIEENNRQSQIYLAETEEKLEEMRQSMLCGESQITQIAYELEKAEKVVEHLVAEKERLESDMTHLMKKVSFFSLENGSLTQENIAHKRRSTNLQELLEELRSVPALGGNPKAQEIVGKMELVVKESLN